ncbi:MAG: MBL fold metallo-hydrolase [Syntrophaceae bacterium]|nr:MBL fold metallo-hydrolase [Syntrophaceae bacterium]
MEQKRFGSVQFIPGKNGGKYPYCNSLFVEEAGIIIDPSSNRKILQDLRDRDKVNAVWLSHFHEDHFGKIDVFDGMPIWISERDAPPMAGISVFLDWYGIDGIEEREYWQRFMEEHFHYRPLKPSRFFQDGEVINLESEQVEVIPTPGHTPGNLSFFFRNSKVLFLGDYDLTSFGPWYGDRYSSIEKTLESIRLLREIPADVWLTSHETGVFTSSPGPLWSRYEEVIFERERKILALLKNRRTLQEIVSAWICYGKPRAPKAFFDFAEGALIRKHLEYLLKRGLIRRKGEHYIQN